VERDAPMRRQLEQDRRAHLRRWLSVALRSVAEEVRGRQIEGWRRVQRRDTLKRRSFCTVKKGATRPGKTLDTHIGTHSGRCNSTNRLRTALLMEGAAAAFPCAGMDLPSLRRLPPSGILVLPSRRRVSAR
jgi:hypothetical protein